jgi:Ni/Co efflux regulator RcnB
MKTQTAAAVLGSMTSPVKAAAARENGKLGGRPVDETAWNRWYRNARHEMSFRYGMRRIPVDAYKTQWALGDTVQEGCRTIAQQITAYGDSPF